MSTPRAARMSAVPAVRMVLVHDSEERGRGQDSSSERVLAGAMSHIEAFEPLVTHSSAHGPTSTWLGRGHTCRTRVRSHTEQQGRQGNRVRRSQVNIPRVAAQDP